MIELPWLLRLTGSFQTDSVPTWTREGMRRQGLRFAAEDAGVGEDADPREGETIGR
jgi:hypothetical protein